MNSNNLKLFKSYFRGREDTFAEQTNSGYSRIAREFTDQDLLAHLTGQKSYGIYTVIPPNKTHFLLWDIDHRDLFYLEKIKEASIKVGIKQEQLLLEDSGGKGYHGWIFFDEALDAQKVQDLGRIVVALAEIEISIEVFPKQGKVGDNSFGSLVKLPIGIHQESKKRSVFLNSKFEPTSTWPLWLTAIQKINKAQVESILNEFDYLLPKVSSAQNKPEMSGAKSLSCFRRILEGGVPEGQRDNISFRLAVYLKKQGLPSNQALLVVRDWNTKKNKPPLEDRIIKEKVKSAYEKEYSGYGCEQEYMKNYCNLECPIKQKQIKVAQMGKEAVKETMSQDKEANALTLPQPEEEKLVFRPEPFPIDLIPEGWLQDYIALISPTTEAPVQFHIATWLAILGTICKRNVWFSWAGGRNLYCNVYVVVIGDSGVSRKSTALHYAYTFLNKIERQSILSGMVSTEAFCEEFHIFPFKVMVQDELRSFIDNTNKNYGKGLIPKITEIWSCPSEVRMNFKNIPIEKRIIPNPTLSFLSATTPEWVEMKEADVTGGFLGRFLPICSLGEETKDIPLPPKVDEAKQEQIVNFLQSIADLRGEFTLTPEAKEVFEGLYIEHKKKFKDVENKASIQSFWSRVPDHIIKLAMLFHLSSKDKPDLILTKDTIMRAYAAMDYIKGYYKFFLSRLTFSKEHRIENKAIDMIVNVKEGYMPISRLMQYLRLNSKECYNLMATLEAKEAIKRGEIKTVSKPKAIAINPQYLAQVRENLGDKLNLDY